MTQSTMTSTSVGSSFNDAATTGKGEEQKNATWSASLPKTEWIKTISNVANACYEDRDDGTIEENDSDDIYDDDRDDDRFDDKEDDRDDDGDDDVEDDDDSDASGNHVGDDDTMEKCLDIKESVSDGDLSSIISNFAGTSLIDDTDFLEDVSDYLENRRQRNDPQPSSSLTKEEMNMIVTNLANTSITIEDDDFTSKKSTDDEDITIASSPKTPKEILVLGETIQKVLDTISMVNDFCCSFMDGKRDILENMRESMCGTTTQQENTASKTKSNHEANVTTTPTDTNGNDKSLSEASGDGALAAANDDQSVCTTKTDDSKGNKKSSRKRWRRLRKLFPKIRKSAIRKVGKKGQIQAL